jgi:hypothetical protein
MTIGNAVIDGGLAGFVKAPRAVGDERVRNAVVVQRRPR